MYETRSKAREGLDKLLAKYPNVEVGQIYNQQSNVVKVLRGSLPYYTFTMGEGEWTVVDLVEFPESNILRFAIWNHTGNVYGVDSYGAAEDDPFITVTEFSKIGGRNETNDSSRTRESTS
jgi:hypothetical protein